MQHSDNIPSPPVPTLNEKELLDYIEIIVKHWRKILMITFSATLISIIVALLLPKKYCSTARFLPPQQDVGLMSLMLGQSAGAGAAASLAGGLLGIGTPADQYASILNSERISDAIIDRYKLMQVYNEDYRLDMYDKLDDLVDIKAGKKDGIISITVEDEEPQRAADIANAYVDELGKLTAELNMSSGAKSKQFLNKRLIISRSDLAEAENQLRKFQSKNKAIDVTEQAKASIVGIADLRAQLVLQNIQLAALKRRFTDNSQEVKDATVSLYKTKNQISKLEGSGNHGAIPTVGEVPKLEQEYIRLMREFKVQETLVDLLTKQYELAKLTESRDTDNIQVIQKAKPADKKYKPKRTLIVICTTILTFIFSIFYILFKDFQNNLTENELKKWRKLKAALNSKHKIKC